MRVLWNQRAMHMFFSGDDIDILVLCAMGSNEEAGNIILRNKPDEEDY